MSLFVFNLAIKMWWECEYHTTEVHFFVVISKKNQTSVRNSVFPCNHFDRQNNESCFDYILNTLEKHFSFFFWFVCLFAYLEISPHSRMLETIQL